MWKLQQVELLDFSNSYVNGDTTTRDFIPHQIALLNHLRYLYLRGNRLKTLPNAIMFCENLEVLDVRYNRFTEFPLFLKDMPNLKLLQRTHNELHWTDLSYELQTIKNYPSNEQNEDNEGEITNDADENERLGNENDIGNEGIATDSKTPATQMNADTLCDIALKAICKPKLLSLKEIDALNMPRELKGSLRNCVESWHYCYSCKKGLDKKIEGK